MNSVDGYTRLCQYNSSSDANNYIQLSIPVSVNTTGTADTSKYSAVLWYYNDTSSWYSDYGTVILTFDTFANKSFSGTCSGTLYKNGDISQKIYLVDGKFVGYYQ